MIKEYARELIRRINEDILHKRDGLATGSCASFEDYKQTCGQIRGLELARQIIEDTLQNIEEDEDV